MSSSAHRIHAHPADRRHVRVVARTDVAAGRLMLLTLGFAGLTLAGLVVAIASLF